MADNETPPPIITSSAADPSATNLRIITLAHGSNREDDLYITVPLEYTIGQLKDRMKFILPGTPPAEQQRLIYLGRPLLDNSATLRSILRHQGTEQSTHNLHLVIRSDATSVPTSNQPAATNPQPAPQHAPHPLQAQNVQAGNVPQIAQLPNLLQNMFNPAQFGGHPAHLMQQHMAIHNQHVANFHHGVPQFNVGDMHQIHGPPPGFLNHGQAAAQLDQNENTPSNPNHTSGHNHTAAPSIPSTATFPTQQQGMTMRVQESIGPNGERIRVVTNSTGPMVQREVHNASHTNPLERSTSAPGTAERSDTPGPPQMHRTNQNPLMPVNALPFPHRQFHLPRPGLLNLSAPIVNPTVWLLSSPTGPQALLFAPGHGYFSTTTAPQTAAQSSQVNTTNVSGSQQQPAPGQADPIATPRQNQDQGQGNNVDQAQPRDELVLRPQDQPQPQVAGNAVPRLQNREGGEIAAFVIQRGWLFLRLYMFIFVLSEPGTWRRIILLGIATLVCFLPQQNPLTDAFNVARRHFDNLVGPPQPRQLPPPVDQARRPGNGEVAQGARPGNGPADAAQNNQRAGPNAMPTPEENARRLLREYQGGDQSFVRSLLRPVEQAVALFLASLIPGVGERHVRAREEARQLIAEEEQRRRTEVEQQQQQQAGQQAADSEVSAVGNDVEGGVEEAKREEPQSLASASRSGEPTASSTGVDTASGESASTTDEGLRQRNNESNQQPPPNLTADW